MNAIVTGRPFVFNGNVHNRGGALIGNLPGDSCVEVPCVASRTGIAPVAVGELPPACAALIRTNINVQDLAVRGILEERRDLIYQAAMLDPNTGSTLTLPAIRKLCDAMFAAHAKRLPRGLARAGKTITGRKRA
jgi:alpha-galactosidase